MKKIKILVLTLLCVLCVSVGSVNAVSFDFLGGMANGGQGTATMDIEISGNTLTATLNNTSTVDLVGGTTGGNSPGITGFGFNLDPSTLLLSSWTLKAYDTAGDSVEIGSNVASGNWMMGTTQAGVTLDYLPQTVNGLDGALFNPDVQDDANNTLPGGENDVYFTTAILTMNFNATPLLTNIAYVRMQNVGEGGGGSLKIYGAPREPPNSVPEPGTMLLLGSGLIGLGAFSRKQLLKK